MANLEMVGQNFSDAFTGGLSGGISGGVLAALIALGIIVMILMIAIAIVLYVIKSLALMKIAKKLKVKNAWLAWIPVADFYILTQTAKQNGLLTLIFIGVLIPFIAGLAWIAICVIGIWLLWITGERIKKPGALSLLCLIPGIGCVIALAIYAWSK